MAAHQAETDTGLACRLPGPAPQVPFTAKSAPGLWVPSPFFNHVIGLELPAEHQYGVRNGTVSIGCLVTIKHNAAEGSGPQPPPVNASSSRARLGPPEGRVPSRARRCPSHTQAREDGGAGFGLVQAGSCLVARPAFCMRGSLHPGKAVTWDIPAGAG